MNKQNNSQDLHILYVGSQENYEQLTKGLEEYSLFPKHVISSKDAFIQLRFGTDPKPNHILLEHKNKYANTQALRMHLSNHSDLEHLSKSISLICPKTIHESRLKLIDLMIA